MNVKHRYAELIIILKPGLKNNVIHILSHPQMRLKNSNLTDDPSNIPSFFKYNVSAL